MVALVVVLILLVAVTAYLTVFVHHHRQRFSYLSSREQAHRKRVKPWWQPLPSSGRKRH